MGGRSKLIIAYLGGSYCGFQRQAAGRTVQGDLERALSRMTRGFKITVHSAGRTDAGVHAAGQVVHLDLPVTIPPDKLVKGLNAVLPPEVRVLSARQVGDGFHARRSARGKLYTYRARWVEALPPWIGLRCARMQPIKDQSAFDRALALLPGTRDMASFTVTGVAVPSTVRTVHRAWSVGRPAGIDLHFVGNGFLRYQVRRMVGALFQVGWSRFDIEAFEELLNTPTLGAQVLTAPAHGLTLERVFYRQSRLLGPMVDSIPLETTDA